MGLGCNMKQIKTASSNIDIPWAKPIFFEKEKEYLAKALESTWISGGYYIDKFEKDFTSYVGSKFGITTSNGTTALQLALMALGIGPGDEVIVPGFTFVAPVNMVIEAGATPVYADIDPLTWCINPMSVKKCITKKTKAIIPVHIYGNVCDMDKLVDIAKKYGLLIIEDAAEAAFSRYDDKYAGTFGDIGCFSFQATKTITMGEGGFVTTDNYELFEKMRIIRSHGMKEGKRYWHDIIGYNFRLTNLQAAVGCAQFDGLNKIINNRKRVHRLYSQQLADIPGLNMQYFTSQVDPVVWAIAVRIDPKYFKGDRDYIMDSFFEAGIETRPGFYPFSVMPLYNAPKLPVSFEIGMNVISLPSFPTLTQDEISLICNHLKGLITNG